MNTSDRWAVHRLLARNTDGRLEMIRRAPQQIVLAGADADESRRLLAQRYPRAVFAEYDPRPAFLKEAAAARRGGLLRKLTAKPVVQHCQSLADPLPEACADMLWSNLGLSTAAEPLPVFENWARALKPEGLLFFTHFGLDSLNTLTGRLKNAGIAVGTPMLFDMHDLGDMLFHHGFYDPVMDTAKLELHYRRAETFWQDMETLGLWASLDFDDEAAARAAVNGLFEGGPQTVTLETLYGHAVRKHSLPAGESPVHFYPKR